MRIWHEKLIHHLCRQHLLACWREGLGCLNILLKGKEGYRNHPQVVMYENHIDDLLYILKRIRIEMLFRGYKPRKIINEDNELLRKYPYSSTDLKEWQTLEEQIDVLKSKKCSCYGSIKNHKTTERSRSS